MKLICGVGNNAAWAVALDAIDHIRRHPRYKQMTKRRFKETMDAFRAYEGTLLCPGDGIRFFDVSDMPEMTRKKYGDITDRDYYEMWAGVGCAAYKSTYPLVTSLQNKFRLSLQKHGIAHPEIIAWGMTAATCLELSVVMYGSVLDDIETQMPRFTRQLRSVFSPFSLDRIARLWQRALISLCPEADGYELESGERRNIELGVEQLQEAWDNIDTIYTSTAKAVEQYDEIFRTKGEVKKALLEISEQYAEAQKART